MSLLTGNLFKMASITAVAILVSCVCAPLNVANAAVHCAPSSYMVPDDPPPGNFGFFMAYKGDAKLKNVDIVIADICADANDDLTGTMTWRSRGGTFDWSANLFTVVGDQYVYFWRTDDGSFTGTLVINISNGTGTFGLNAAGFGFSFDLQAN